MVPIKSLFRLYINDMPALRNYRMKMIDVMFVMMIVGLVMVGMIVAAQLKYLKNGWRD